MKIRYKKLARVSIGFPPSEDLAAMATWRGVTAYLKRDISLHFRVEDGYTYFYLTDMKEALAILKGLASYFNADFIWQVASDLERDIHRPAQAKLLTYSQYFHICEKCAMEMDIRHKNSSHKEGVWSHLVCPELKKERPV